MKTPFQIHIGQSILDDLKARLANTRWTDEIQDSNWKYGADKTYLKDLCNYWQHEFDWRQQEIKLNAFPQYKAIVEGTGIHFLYCRGEGKTSVPLLLIHGFPDSFVRFLKIIPLLTQADENDFSFDLVIPSIPGYGFSDIPAKPGMDPGLVAKIFTRLMTGELGYQTFFAHGGDWGSSIIAEMVLNDPGSLSGIHLTDMPFRYLLNPPPGDLTAPEKKFMEQGRQWQQTEGAYAAIQSTKPQTLAYGLNDSPAGLAAWIIEMFHSWSDCNGSLDSCFTKDELLTDITIYWVTQTINPAIRIYYETMQYIQRRPGTLSPKEGVPAAMAIFPKDLVNAPREFAERLFNIKQWTKMPEGGHFAAMEQPGLLAEDIRKFITALS
ncbi:hypothetical protein HA402_012054 [Bradysia odoriphaga]|nr:hypothetical protein HA402_012054 [Bradysia odoriphaga]